MFTALFLAALVGKLLRFDRPWTVGLDQVGARNSVIARHFVDEGLFRPPWRQKIYTGDPPPELKGYTYCTHPPLVPWLTAVAFTVTGSVQAWAARLAMLPASLIALGLVALLAGRAGGRRLAAAAALVMAVAPGANYRGVFVDAVGWWLVVFHLLFVCLMLPWFDPERGRVPGVRRGLGLAATFVLGMLVEWHLAIWLPVLLVEWRLASSGRRLGAILPILLAIPVVAGLYRLGLPPPDPGQGYTFVWARLARFHQWSFDHLAAVLHHAVDVLAGFWLAVAALGLVVTIVRIVRRRLLVLDRMVLALLAVHGLTGLIYPLGAAIHDYYHLLLTAPAALLAGRTVLSLFDLAAARLGRRRASVATALLLFLGCGIATHHTCVRWAECDAHVPQVLAYADTLRNAVRRDEVAATPRRRAEIESIGFYSDRIVVPSVVTVGALQALQEGSLRAAVYVLHRDEMGFYPDLVAYLEAGWPRMDTPWHAVYDLRTPSRNGPGPPRASTVRGDPPRNIRASSINGRVEISWDRPATGTVAGYRLFFANEPGAYLTVVDVAASPFVCHIAVTVVIHFAVAAVGADGILGTLSADRALRVEGSANSIEPILALLLATVVTMSAYGVLVFRRAGAA